MPLADPRGRHRGSVRARPSRRRAPASHLQLGRHPITLGELADLVRGVLPDARSRSPRTEAGEESGNYLVDNSRLVKEFGVEYPPLRTRILEIITTCDSRRPGSREGSIATSTREVCHGLVQLISPILTSSSPDLYTTRIDHTFRDRAPSMERMGTPPGASTTRGSSTASRSARSATSSAGQRFEDPSQIDFLGVWKTCASARTNPAAMVKENEMDGVWGACLQPTEGLFWYRIRQRPLSGICRVYNTGSRSSASRSRIA